MGCYHIALNQNFITRFCDKNRFDALIGIGVLPNILQHLMTAAAMNLMRVLDWLSGKQRATTKVSAFARLAAA